MGRQVVEFIRRGTPKSTDDHRCEGAFRVDKQKYQITLVLHVTNFLYTLTTLIFTEIKNQSYVKYK